MVLFTCSSRSRLLLGDYIALDNSDLARGTRKRVCERSQQLLVGELDDAEAAGRVHSLDSISARVGDDHPNTGTAQISDQSGLPGDAVKGRLLQESGIVLHRIQAIDAITLAVAQCDTE